MDHTPCGLLPVACRLSPGCLSLVGPRLSSVPVTCRLCLFPVDCACRVSPVVCVSPVACACRLSPVPVACACRLLPVAWGQARRCRRAREGVGPPEKKCAKNSQKWTTHLYTPRHVESQIRTCLQSSVFYAQGSRNWLLRLLQLLGITGDYWGYWKAPLVGVLMATPPPEPPPTSPCRSWVVDFTRPCSPWWFLEPPDHYATYSLSTSPRRVAIGLGRGCRPRFLGSVGFT